MFLINIRKHAIMHVKFIYSDSVVFKEEFLL